MIEHLLYWALSVSKTKIPVLMELTLQWEVTSTKETRELHDVLGDSESRPGGGSGGAPGGDCCLQEKMGSGAAGPGPLMGRCLVC